MGSKRRLTKTDTRSRLAAMQRVEFEPHPGSSRSDRPTTPNSEPDVRCTAVERLTCGLFCRCDALSEPPECALRDFVEKRLFSFPVERCKREEKSVRAYKQLFNCQASDKNAQLIEPTQIQTCIVNTFG